MNKNISINVGGINFNIEESAYEKLSHYLLSVKNYFLKHDGNEEIMKDIESRIAEIFNHKISSKGVGVISMEDVKDVIKTIGEPTDFDLEMEENQEDKSYEFNAREKFKSKKRVYRDVSRKWVAGVCSGLARYFDADPLWFRLVALVLLLNIFSLGISSVVAVIYIILWIIMPVQKEWDNTGPIKTLFRDSSHKTIAGVCSGIAAYFSIEILLVRVVFVLSILLGGSGVLLYLLLWTLTPVAVTVKDKMQMEGQPFTLSNIQDNLKKE